MSLRYGIRPFEFEDFTKMIQHGKIDITNVDYIDVLQSSLPPGFKHYEISSDLAYVLPGFLTTEVIHRLSELNKRNSYTCSVHLPLWAIELASPNMYIKKASINCLVEAIELTKPLNPENWVIHATGNLIAEFAQMNLPGNIKEFMYMQFAQSAQDSLEEILQQTNISSRKLA
ncbi:MAG: hypothetical protein ACXACR_16380, partial [Candidatus Hodarchaeales archaeon]